MKVFVALLLVCAVYSAALPATGDHVTLDEAQLEGIFDIIAKLYHLGKW